MRDAKIDVEHIRNELKALSDSLTNDVDVAKVRGELHSISRRFYRLHDLQRMGLKSIPETQNTDKGANAPRSEAAGLLQDLERQGLFLVPVGVLESWLPILMKGQSREDKSKWAMLAAEKIEDVGEREDEVCEFTRRVYTFLLKQVQSLSKKPTNSEN